MTNTQPVFSRTGDFVAFLARGREDALYEWLCLAEAVGRPIGGVDFAAELEKRLKRRLFQ